MERCRRLFLIFMVMIVVICYISYECDQFDDNTAKEEKYFPRHVHKYHLPQCTLRKATHLSLRRVGKEIDFPNEGLRKQPPPFGYSEGIVGSPSISYHIWRILSSCLRKNLDNPCKICYNTRTGNYRPGGRHPSQKTGKQVRGTAYRAGTAT